MDEFLFGHRPSDSDTRKSCGFFLIDWYGKITSGSNGHIIGKTLFSLNNNCNFGFFFS